MAIPRNVSTVLFDWFCSKCVNNCDFVKQPFRVFRCILYFFFLSVSILHSNRLKCACNIQHSLSDAVATVHSRICQFYHIRCSHTGCKISQENPKSTSLEYVTSPAVFTGCCSYFFHFIKSTISGERFSSYPEIQNWFDDWIDNQAFSIEEFDCCLADERIM